MLPPDAQYGVWSDLLIPEELLKYSDGRYKATNAEIAEWAETEGYDALRINNVRDGSFDVGSEIIFFEENLVKSADAITKDKNGDIIPLSERFNDAETDIRYSLPTQTDSDGRQLSEGQQEYFKDSKVRDDDGKLLVMYQGAQSEFFEFDRKKSSPYNLYGRGFYFTDSKSHANQYGTAREYYLNIKNPVPTSKEDSIITREQMRKYLEAVAENEDDYDIWNYGTTDIDVILDKVFDGRSDFAMLQDVNATAIGDLVAAIELFNEINGTAFDGIFLATETVIFNSEQAKLTSNAVPTTNPDIRYSLPDNRSDLLQRFKDGEITEEEFAESWDNKPSK